MQRLKPILSVGAAVVAVFASGEALATGKAGLWSITTTMNFGAGGPQMPQMTPDQIAQMQKLGIQMPAMPGAKPFVSQQCVTPQQAASSQPQNTMREQDKCVMQNLQTNGRTFSADMVCTGETKGTGTLKVTYDSDEHYSGSMNFMGTTQNQPANIMMTFDGKWLKADCTQ